jgi:hypothetical protein
MNLGLVGAIGGAAKGFDSYITEEQAMQRQQRMENLRAKNTRDTNTQNNDQRHKNAVELQGIKAEDDISLTEMRNQARMDEVKAISDRPTTGGANLTTLVEKGMPIEEAIDRVFPKGGRTGSTELDVKRDAFKAMATNMTTQGSTPQQAAENINALMEQAGLTEAPGAPEGLDFATVDDLMRQIDAEAAGDESKKARLLEAAKSHPQFQGLFTGQ